MIPTLVTLYGDDPEDIARAWPRLSAAQKREAVSMGFFPLIVKAAQVGAKVGLKVGKAIAKKVKSKRKAKRRAAAAKAAAVAAVPVVRSVPGGVSPPTGSAALPVTVTPEVKRYLIYGGVAALAILLLTRKG